jgi:hypothetical protein
MSTFEEAARSALAAVDCDASYVLAAQWAVERYQQLSSRLRFRHLRTLGRVTVPATYSVGTITVTRGDLGITGVSTAWTADLEDRFIRARVNWYKVLKVASATSITIDQPFSEDSVAGGTYHIIAKQIPLDEEARWIGNDLVHSRLRRPLDKISMAEMDVKYPERLIVGPPPVAWCQTQDALNTNGKLCLAVEVYPYPTNAEMLHYVFWKIPPLYKPEEEIPRVLDMYQLKEGTLINVMQYNAAQCANPQSLKFSIEAAVYWRNEFRQQNTTWERIILDVGKQDRGTDDLTFILQMTRSHMGWYSGIHTAHDEIYSRGRRP